MFYYLKGGQVDYGEEHSKECGHSQFGRIYEQGLDFLDIGDLHVMFVVCSFFFHFTYVFFFNVPLFWYIKSIILSGMRITLFILWDILLEHRLFVFCNKCLLIRLVLVLVLILCFSFNILIGKRSQNVVFNYVCFLFFLISITSLSGAFNGTTRTYFDGIQ